MVMLVRVVLSVRNMEYVHTIMIKIVGARLTRQKLGGNGLRQPSNSMLN